MSQAPMPKIAKNEPQVFVFLSVWVVFVGFLFFGLGGGGGGGQNSFFSLISSRNPDFLVLFVSAALPRFSSQVDVSQLSAA